VQVSDDPRVGTELAGYRIESLLGWGGMSVVYLAEDLRLKRRVALKLLAASLAEDESFRDRFLRESELAASIDHPNIVPIYEAGTAEDILFIAMRYVEGRDLKERLERGRLDPADAIGLLTQVASALDAAHARGLVHRDVKPSNVLLDTGARPDGSDHVYLADFGITKRVSEETGVGDDGHLLGTIDYIAPEQIAGEEIDGRADFAEVKKLGALNSSKRTVRQTTAAIFWQFAPAALWNRLARDLSAEHDIAVADEARLLAMINLAAADGAIACWNDKYHWNFWRPRAAIQEADTDGNPATVADPTWEPLFHPSTPTTPALITPPFPDHPSGHGCVSGAVLHTFREFFGTNRVAFDVHSGRFPDQPRHFKRFTRALKEIIDARVWGGIHFRTADVQGAVIGKKVARWLEKHYFQPTR
jgi:serine/threonine protein kinase